MPDEPSSALPTTRLRATALTVLVAALGAVSIWAATNPPFSRRAGTQPPATTTAGTRLPELDDAIAATRNAVTELAVQQTSTTWAGPASRVRSDDTYAALRRREPVSSDSVTRTADGNWSWITHQSAWDGPDAAGEQLRRVDDQTYWSSERLPVPGGDPGWWHVVDHRIDYVELYPEQLLDNAAAHESWRMRAGTDATTRYHAVDLDIDNDGLAFTVGQDHGLLMPFAEGEPRDEVLSADLTLVVDDITGRVTRVEAERRGVDHDSNDARQDVIERAEMTFHGEGIEVIAPTDAHDIPEDQWAACAHGGTCDSSG